MGRDLKQWMEVLKPTLDPIKSFVASDFWRQSSVAFKSGLMDEFFSKDVATKAWIIAYVETEELLKQVRDYLEETKVPK